MSRAGELRHRVNVMRPPQAPLSTRGQPQGNDTLVIEGWPCRVVQTGASEADESGGPSATATFEVSGYADPKRPIKQRDYLLFNGRRLDVSSVVDPDMRGVEVVLNCGEVVSG